VGATFFIADARKTLTKPVFNDYSGLIFEGFRLDLELEYVLWTSVLSNLMHDYGVVPNSMSAQKFKVYAP